MRDQSSPEYAAKIQLSNIKKHLVQRKHQDEDIIGAQSLDEDFKNQRDSLMENSLTKDPATIELKPYNPNSSVLMTGQDITMDDQSLFSHTQDKVTLEGLSMSIIQPSQFDVPSLENMAKSSCFLSNQHQSENLSKKLSELQQIAWKARFSLQSREAKKFAPNRSNTRDMMTKKFGFLRDNLDF